MLEKRFAYVYLMFAANIKKTLPQWAWEGLRNVLQLTLKKRQLQTSNKR